MNHFPESQYKEFLKLSKKIGSNIELVQGAGGNTSIKDDKILSVKASGKLLSNSLTEEIFVNIDIKKSNFLFLKIYIVILMISSLINRI